MLNAEGYVAECTADNLFIVRDGTLLTPPPRDGGLEGITRATVLEIAEKVGVPCAETRLARFDVFTANECFVTGTGAEIMHIREVDGRVIADGSAGPITRRLAEAFHERVRSEGEPLW